MKRKEKIIGSLIISVIAILFLFIGYSKTNDKKISDSDMEKLFIDKEESEDTNELEDFNEKESSSKKEESNNIKEEKDSDIESEKEGKKTSLSEEKIIVEIKGEVKKPNVYELKNGSRIYELIEEAGGPTDEADLSNINRALYLSDGQCIVIKNINDVESEEANLNEFLNAEVTNSIPTNSSGDKGEKNESSIININTASKETLMTLNGIGESKAQAIIDYRDEIGGFKSVDDITNVSGIGEKTLEKIKDKISIK
ncbi:ComEA family DNA-binding protein [Clostridium perfringens]|uniref:ComEA family DNA-binding protein n=1 Tax=Clostridium perfringens TaxID=1502 RepID=UPI0024448F8E|nr:ComEA family DNA-binding protein [Clostridium perfringens]MDG6875936.1 ComE operon protein 1 [Clostridium perfringens]MDM0447981.1 ComEA family DNA-binding protein [Clostridium perfringens]MDZ5040651.1 competence protein ComE [Clostridium perfringens]